MKPRNYWLRNADSASLAEIFFVTSALTVVLIRIVQYLADYPQIGGAKYHIAHMLWGGLLLLLALLLVLFTLNRRTKFLAAFLGGVGWGLFIDELGKFITRDNDYWFKPTYALIYVSFILLFFSIRYYLTKRSLSATEHAANSLELLKEVAADDYSPQEKERILAHLKEAKAQGKDVRLLERYAASAKVSAKHERSLYVMTKSYLLTRYHNLLRYKWLRRSISYLFALQALWYALSIAKFFFTRDLTPIDISSYGFFEWGRIVSSSVVIVFILIGLLTHQRFYENRLPWFKRATLVALLIVGFFNYYHEQLMATLGVVFHALVLYALHVIESTTDP